jgi:hypothetical protein
VQAAASGTCDPHTSRCAKIITRNQEPHLHDVCMTPHRLSPCTSIDHTTTVREYRESSIKISRYQVTHTSGLRTSRVAMFCLTPPKPTAKSQACNRESRIENQESRIQNPCFPCASAASKSPCATGPPSPYDTSARDSQSIQVSNLVIPATSPTGFSQQHIIQYHSNVRSTHASRPAAPLPPRLARARERRHLCHHESSDPLDTSSVSPSPPSSYTPINK